jgi:hypothetical protein
VRPITVDAAEQLWVGRLTRTLTTIALDGYRDWSGIPQPDPLTVLLLAADSRYAGGCSSPTRMRAKPVASDREGVILVRLWPGDEQLNFYDGIRFAVQGRAMQEPQQVLRESLRVQDVGDVLLPGQYQPLCIG